MMEEEEEEEEEERSLTETVLEEVEEEGEKPSDREREEKRRDHKWLNGRGKKRHLEKEEDEEEAEEEEKPSDREREEKRRGHKRRKHQTGRGRRREGVTDLLRASPYQQQQSEGAGESSGRLICCGRARDGLFLSPLRCLPLFPDMSWCHIVKP
ncbi:hypothetical protein O3P69_006948 [Scylla paramamosain]|uniref:Uncharacterized protein n=1 Tax=Scylla paramamosain TaxID=85552 RepID=A0AAW0U1X2_SCYPA